MSRANQSWLSAASSSKERSGPRSLCSSPARDHCALALLLLSTTFAIAGCATRVPQVMTPEIVPKTFISQTAGSAAVWPRTDWWRGFGSPELSQFIETAQESNRDLAAAMARVTEAQAQTFIARSALFPQLTLQAIGERTNNGVTTPIGTPISRSTTSATTNAFGLGLGASYELDFWGLAQANLRAANETLKASRFAQQVEALSITAAVADAYFNVLALREQIAIAHEDITAINGILDVIKLRVSTGTYSHLDLAREQAQVEAVDSQLPALEEAELEARVGLAVLLGRPPEAFDVKAQSSDGIQLPDVAPGIPSELLLRRPDVAEAEANLASAHANLDAARAAFLPQFSLTGTSGFASTAVNALLHGPSFVWDAGANLVGAIFNGTLIGQKNLAYATQRELVASYQGAVLNAYVDVESALGQVKHYAEEEDDLRREVDAAREAFDIAQLQYRQGAADLLTVLQAQQTLFAARNALARTRLARMQAVVHLFEALGGGWTEPPKDRTQFPLPG
jgi:outer membrane protein, multidrug efflux system